VSWRGLGVALWLATVTVGCSSLATAQNDGLIVDFDTNHDAELSIEELTPFFAAKDPECASEEDLTKRTACAKLRAADFISGNLPMAKAPSGIPLSVARVQVGLYLQERAAEVLAARRAKQEKLAPRAYGLQLSRTISDPAWFSAWKEKRPFVLSFKHDARAAEGTKRDSYVVLGSIGYVFPPTASSPDLRRQRAVAVGLEFDSDSAKAASESSLSFGVPVQWSWAFVDPVAGLDGLALKVQPKVISDRRFDREVYATDVTLSVAKESVAIGYLAWSSDWSNGTTPLLSFHWNPTLTLQALRVDDAAGNEKLAKLEGEGIGLRAVPRIQLTFGFPQTNGRLSFVLDARAVWDEKSGDTFGFGEGNLSFKLSRFAELALIYRRGYKGDELAKVDEFLAGIGIQFGD